MSGDRTPVAHALLRDRELELDGFAGGGDDRLATFEGDVVFDGAVVDEDSGVCAGLCDEVGGCEHELARVELDGVVERDVANRGRSGSAGSGPGCCAGGPCGRAVVGTRRCCDGGEYEQGSDPDAREFAVHD